MSLVLALPGDRSLEVEPGPSLLAGALDGQQGRTRTSRATDGCRD